MTGISFGSDNHAGVHPDVLAAVVEANAGTVPAYGDDAITAEAKRLLRAQFGEGAEAFVVFNGTGANVVGLASMVRSFESVICADSAHINVDECGAPEKLLGAKLVDVPAPGGKLTVGAVDAARWGVGDPHHVQAKVVSITQSTECGTVYTLDEIRALADYVHARDMYLHLDGARVANAAVSLGVDLGDLGAAAGVDVLSFGATKNGAMGAEAVIVLRPELAGTLEFLRKQSMQLASKMRFLSAQIVALLTDDLWRRNAENANAMATRLASAVQDAPGVTITDPVQANAVFALIAPRATEILKGEFPFEVWRADTGQVRWMTSWATQAADVDAFAARIREVTGQHA